MVSRIILGVDPGLHVTGFSVLKKERQQVILLDYGCLTFSSSQSLSTRVGLFAEFFDTKITTLNITDIALETPFLGKNIQSFLKLGYLRGVLYYLSYRRQLAIHEYTPTQVKLSVTGYGAAQKEQVAQVIVRLFPGIQLPKKLDVTDALAVTLCGLWQQQLPILK